MRIVKIIIIMIIIILIINNNNHNNNNKELISVDSSYSGVHYSPNDIIL